MQKRPASASRERTSDKTKDRSALVLKTTSAAGHDTWCAGTDDSLLHALSVGGYMTLQVAGALFHWSILLLKLGSFVQSWSWRPVEVDDLQQFASNKFPQRGGGFLRLSY
jgi:hypothetical protein